MRLCSLPYNITLVFCYSFPPSDLFYIDKDQNLNGKYGIHIANNIFLDKYEESKKYCKFAVSKAIGTYFPANNTYTDSLKIIAESDSAALFKSTDYYMDKGDLLDFTTVFQSINFQANQVIDKKTTQKNDYGLIDFLDYLLPSLEFLIFLFASLIFYFLSLFFIMKLKNVKSKNLAITILSFSFVLFLFFMDNLYNSNLNTSNVIVDTSDILDSLDKILNTKKELCINEDSSEFSYFTQSTDKNSLAYKIYAKMNKSDPCFVYDTSGNFGKAIRMANSKDIFLLNYDLAGNLLSRAIQTFARLDTYISQVQLYESLRSFIISNKMKKEIKNYINKCVDYIFVHGFMKRFVDNFPNYSNIQLAKVGGKDGFITYTSTQQYIADYTKIDTLSLERLEILFQAYFGFLILILIIYLIHLLVVYLRYFIDFKKKNQN